MTEWPAQGEKTVMINRLNLENVTERLETALPKESIPGAVALVTD